MDRIELLTNELIAAYTDRKYLQVSGNSRDEVLKMRDVFSAIAKELIPLSDEHGRLHSSDILAAGVQHIEAMAYAPSCGWASHCYGYVLNRIFPHLPAPEDADGYEPGTLAALALLRGVYSYERAACSFDPCLDFPMLSDQEVKSAGYTSEYIAMKRLARSNYIYEFMRLGSEITPFNTLGHIAGVHYVATYMARQMRDAGIPVDLALVSGAAASHDIGKYGCRKSEERRVPYLHYYYTDYCMTGNGMPEIAHIAANHSTWDLEFENLSAESLLLIYADFRVKSTRDPAGREIIHFYTLAEAFSVILGKLDNVDEAKRHRYEKVYARLRDFEEYMTDRGIITDLLSSGPAYREDRPVRVSRELSLVHGDEIIDQLKFKAVDHNIRLMHHFAGRDDFAQLIEMARGEQNWKALRTYITILGEYSTYMTEDQKALTLRFLYDQLTHRESDIREQSARQMGQIVATFRQAYRKELPEDIPRLDETTTNLEMFSNYLEKIAFPSSKLTEQHRHWIIQSMDFFVSSAIESCAPQFLTRYLDVLAEYYKDNFYDERTVMSILHTPIMIREELITDTFRQRILDFARNTIGGYSAGIDLLALDVIERYDPQCSDNVRAKRREIMGVCEASGATDEMLSAMFLDDLKFQTSWIRKVANIRYMAEVSSHTDGNVRLHIATHFVNLIKVSETVTVRRVAGDALLGLVPDMPLDQRNEIMVELFNGLEIEDYQFSRLVPDYLGHVMLCLPPDEMDEAITSLEGYINSGVVKTASASLITLSILLENYSGYRFDESADKCDARIRRITGLLMKGLAHYKPAISHEAARVFGERIFAGDVMTMDGKKSVLQLAGKRFLSLIPDDECEPNLLEFFSNSALLKSIYRYISGYLAENDAFGLEHRDKVAFFPGTFDPFSLGHKAIARTIRDLGFEVYLALDEFSWSKKTLPHMLRRNILSMSIADEPDVHIFPDDIPVNIANPRDMKRLRELFAGRELYIAVGSDVIRNASSYKAKPEKDSIHTFNHIVFAREAKRLDAPSDTVYPVSGKVINLTLRKYYEDISSTRIRDNIDLGRDISNLLDPVVQNYIYDNNMYVRQPAYKHEIQARDIIISDFEHRNYTAVGSLEDELTRRGYDFRALSEYISRPRVRTVYIEGGDSHEGQVYAFASARRIERHDLLFEFGDTDLTRHIRGAATGAIGVIGALYFGKNRSISSLGQIILTELITNLLARDYGYVIYHPVDSAGMNPATIEVLRRQGFINISGDHDNPVYAADLTSPVVIFKDVETVIKAPLNKNPRVMKAVEDAHGRLLRTFSELYPGRIILSFNTSAVYSKIIRMVAAENGVSTVPDPKRRRGPYMAVPFGKALSDVVVPNTVTKALRTEKYVDEMVRSFTIRESAGYAGLDEQVETLKSFGRDVILIDDLLHSGQRMKRIDPILRAHDVNVRKVIVGLLTGNARDEMSVSRRPAEGAYFIPSISMWLNERDCYPFIGGDSIDNDRGEETSINLILPYTSFSFVGGSDEDMIYKYSMTCLENARDILRVLEQEYLAAFEKQLTLGRLSAVLTHPRRPDYGDGLKCDENVPPSVYVESDIRRAERLHLTRH